MIEIEDPEFDMEAGKVKRGYITVGRDHTSVLYFTFTRVLGILQYASVQHLFE